MKWKKYGSMEVTNFAVLKPFRLVKEKEPVNACHMFGWQYNLSWGVDGWAPRYFGSSRHHPACLGSLLFATTADVAVTRTPRFRGSAAMACFHSRGGKREAC